MKKVLKMFLLITLILIIGVYFTKGSKTKKTFDATFIFKGSDLIGCLY